MQIVRTARYLKDLKRLRVSQADQEALEQSIANNPTAGDVIQGLGGIRKIRFGFGGRGKSGGGRAIYVLMVADDQAIMLMAYAKNEQEDLSSDQRKAVLAIVKEITNG